jgi:hypothetical protein
MRYVAARIEFRHVLRWLARERAALSVFLADGSQLAGTLDRVCADHVDLAVHDLAESRRRMAVRAVRVLPLAALVALRRREVAGAL